jgi:PPOX class probable F420-dependent enzyme
MSSPIPADIRGQKYVSLITFRRNGAAVATAVWFGEDDDKLYIMTRSISGKYKRLRNNTQVRVAPCSIRGVVTGPESAATARILPTQEHAHAAQTVRSKYWQAWISQLWSRADVFIEIAFP